ncbi:MAG: hypothetical protein KAH38_00640, partial [Candidatus Hydrogenedentes bacterium]|nr:hypothetical protein [Candidatus Hydrogenedentota bacterium]
EAMAESLGCIPGISEQQGLLARIARSAMEESTFLEQLQQGLRSNDPIQLQELMQCVNSTLDVLCADTVLNEKTVSAL